MNLRDSGSGIGDQGFGIRVRNVQQYRAARGARAQESMRLTVRREGKPLEIAVRLRYRWIVNAVKTYEPVKCPS